MNWDAVLKRYYPLILCGLIAIIAYLQAGAFGHLILSGLTGGSPSAPPSSSVEWIPIPGQDGTPILERNPFDSVTGPLNGQPTEDLGDEPEPPPSEEAPPCPAGRVVIIAQNDDPKWAFAAIDDGSGKSQLTRVGDAINGYKLEQLAWDRVYLTQNGTRCELRLGEASTKAPAPAQPTEEPTARRGTPTLSPEMASRIQRISDTEFNIDRSVVDQIMDAQAGLMRGVRVTPNKSGDKVTGLKVGRVRPDTLFDHLGIKNGDELQVLNGSELTDPQKALEAYGRLATADRLTLQVLRNGAPMTIEYNIR